MKRLLTLCALFLLVNTSRASETHLASPVGTSQVFDVVYRGSGWVDLDKMVSSTSFKASPTSDRMVIGSQLRGRLETVAIGSGVVACRFLSPALRLSIGGRTRTKAENRRTETSLANHWFFVTHSRGVVRGFVFPSNSSGEGRDLMRSLLPLSQFVPGPSKNAQAWTARLSGTPFSIPRAVLWRFARSKHGVKASLEDVSTITRPSTRAVGTMEFFPSRITTRVHMAAHARGVQVAVNDLATTLKVKSRHSVSSSQLSRLRALEQLTRRRGVKLALNQQDPGAKAQRDRQLLAKSPQWQTVFARACSQKPGNAFSVLLVLLRRRPALCTVMARTVVSKGLPERPLNVLLQLLPTVGSHPAQKALILLVRSATPERRNPIFASMGGLTKPTGETMSLLKGSSSSYDGAALSLGACVRALRARGQNLAARDATLFLVASLDNARSKDQAVMFLLALGNAGQSDARAAIARRLASSDPDLRAVACRALRYDNSPQAEMLLCVRLQRDGSAPVRMEALRALSIRATSKTRRRAVANQLKRETNPDIKAALQVLQS